MTSRSVVVLFVLTCAVPVARADEAPPAPESLTCPRGSVGALPTVRPGELDVRGRPLRPWPYCAASRCTTDAECTAGQVCSAEEIGLCVEDHEVEGGDAVRAVRDRGCEPDGTCLNVRSTCERARRCVDAPAAAPPPVAAPAPAPETAPTSAASPAPTSSPAAASSEPASCRATPSRSSRGAAPMLALVITIVWRAARRRPARALVSAPPAR